MNRHSTLVVWWTIYLKNIIIIAGFSVFIETICASSQCWWLVTQNSRIRVRLSKLTQWTGWGRSQWTPSKRSIELPATRTTQQNKNNSHQLRPSHPPKRGNDSLWEPPTGVTSVFWRSLHDWRLTDFASYIRTLLFGALCVCVCVEVMGAEVKGLNGKRIMGKSIAWLKFPNNSERMYNVEG